MAKAGPEKFKKSVAKGKQVYNRKRSQAIKDDKVRRERAQSKQISARNKAQGAKVRKMTRGK